MSELGINKLKTLIVSPCGLPVPAVKGGAVLNLIESLVIKNEKFGNLDLTVISSYDEQAKIKSAAYARTEFVFLRPNMFVRFFDKIIGGLEKAVHKAPHNYGRKLYVLSGIKRILKKENYDKVVFENAGYLLRVLKNKKIAEKYKGKLFYHLHNDIPDNIYVNGVKQCRLLLISEYLKKKLVSFCGEDIKGNIEILHNGFNFKQFSADLPPEEKIKLKTELNIPPDRKVVMFAGRIDPSKGIEQLASAFNEAGREDAVLLVVGSYNFGGSETSPFAERMKSVFANMGDKVRFTGFVPYPDIWKYFKISDVAALPSMWEEPMGLTITEAMSAGLPVITTRAGGIPEFIDERFGVLLERDDNIVINIRNAINSVLDNLDYWQECGKRGSEYIADVVDEEKYYQNFCNLLKN